MELLRTITALSREFGTGDYVKGGGGNTSAKDAETLWIKPSGTTLGEMSETTFLPMVRSRIAELYAIAPPSDPTAREALVKDRMLAAVAPGATGRPSVEAPLHNAFSAAYVVHTHPALVNGMTCSRDGARACADLFPEALWVEYTDPGYTLSMTVKERIDQWRQDQGSEPSLVFLENHGVFVSADRADDIRRLYGTIVERLEGAYRLAKVSGAPAVGAAPTADQTAQAQAAVGHVAGEEAARHIEADGWFEVADGPISPDHIVYSKSFPLVGEPTAESVARFVADRGYAPRVVAWPGVGVFGLGQTAKNAFLALDLARDGAQIQRLAEAFGGIQFLSDQARDFIDNWEVEAYRRKIAE